MDIKPDVEALRFCSRGILYSCGLTQHINSAIMVGTPVSGPCLSSYNGKSFGVHLAAHYIINMHKHAYIRRKIAYRKYRGMINKVFIEDLQL